MPAAYKPVARISPLTPDHASQYRQLMLQAYANHPDAFTSTREERAALPLSWWRERLSSDSKSAEVVIAGWDGDEMVGVAGISFAQRQRESHKSTLFGMYVAPHARGAGLGRELVDAIVALARQRAGVRLIKLTVTQGNESARRLYDACGFVTFGVEPNAVAVDDGYVDKAHMWCDLTKR